MAKIQYLNARRRSLNFIHKNLVQLLTTSRSYLACILPQDFFLCGSNLNMFNEIVNMARKGLNLKRRIPGWYLFYIIMAYERKLCYGKSVNEIQKLARVQFKALRKNERRLWKVKADILTNSSTGELLIQLMEELIENGRNPELNRRQRNTLREIIQEFYDL